ncbi:outer membrane beta-barrel protein [Lutimonas halocynthiae]|uniref:outer membrane beta-barrel protein n=1 Tax=Lutimonas halocynthiae TaxID=1446477 RepID=UPI0025B60DDA|nr:outer membrane beta-barrel protein [Lutimonas halocynthiae]MDN3644150.1 outer membrane beta-barrel protein [Lutimonas halocynthiae]
MKNLYLLLVVFCLTASANAQFLNWGIKGGVNYNENGDLRTINQGNPISLSSNEEVGYHIGILTEIKLPLFLYIRPELVYTHTESSYILDDDQGTLKLDKLELPVLLGFRVFKIGRFFFGPNFSYIMNTKLSVPESIEGVSNVSSDDFLVSGQVGLGLNFGKVGADIRWETGFSDSEASFIRDSTDLDFALVDTSHSQFILSFYYKFK